MSKTRTCYLLVALIVLVCWGPLSMAAAPKPSGPNVGQVDRPGVDLTGAWACPSPTGTTGAFFDVPNLSLSMNTTGGPVLLMLNLNFHGNGSAGFWLSPVIDGQLLDNDRRSWQTGNDGFVDVLSFHRVYTLSSGAHTFGVRMSCTTGIQVFRSWLTVYELPAAK